MKLVKRLIIDQQYFELALTLRDLGEDQPTPAVSQPTQSVPPIQSVDHSTNSVNEVR